MILEASAACQKRDSNEIALFSNNPPSKSGGGAVLVPDLTPLGLSRAKAWGSFNALKMIDVEAATILNGAVVVCGSHSKPGCKLARYTGGDWSLFQDLDHLILSQRNLAILHNPLEEGRLNFEGCAGLPNPVTREQDLVLFMRSPLAPGKNPFAMGLRVQFPEFLWTDPARCGLSIPDVYDLNGCGVRDAFFDDIALRLYMIAGGSTSAGKFTLFAFAPMTRALLKSWELPGKINNRPFHAEVVGRDRIGIYVLGDADDGPLQVWRPAL